MEGVVYEGNLDVQGGGHGRICKCRVQPGDIPAISKPLDHAEGEAYRLLQNTPLTAVIPVFYGLHTEDGQECIVISDVTAGLSSPCLADFKVGTRHYDPDATPEKVAGLIEKQKGSTTDSHGVRLIDAKIRKGGQTVQSWDRKQGLKFTPDEFHAVVQAFVPPELRAKFAVGLAKVYDAFQATVDANPGFRMYAASVLTAYDGDAPADIRVLLIDFAHTHLAIDEEGYNSGDRVYDDGVRKGITALVSFAASPVAGAVPEAAKPAERAAEAGAAAGGTEHVAKTSSCCLLM
jgi:hypothetical protein